MTENKRYFVVDINEDNYEADAIVGEYATLEGAKEWLYNLWQADYEDIDEEDEGYWERVEEDIENMDEDGTDDALSGIGYALYTSEESLINSGYNI